MVEDIVGFGAELEANGFGDGDSLKETHVPVLEARLVDEVANALVHEGSGCWLSEDRAAIGIRSGKPLTAGAKRTNDFRRSIHIPVLTVHAATIVRVKAYTCIIDAGSHTARQTGLELRNSADLPAAKGLARQGRRRVAEERKLIKVVDDEYVPSVELGGPPKHARVVSVGDDIALVRTIVHALRKRVGRAEKQAAREAAVPGNLQ